MIYANEIRIGNLIYTSGQVVYTEEVTSIDSKTNFVRTVSTYRKGEEVHLLEKCNPVPLDEEWLEKFGFVLEDSEDKASYFIKTIKSENREEKIIVPIFYYKGPRPVDEEDDRNSTIIEFVWGPFREIGKDVELQYVHQLQNLFFSLTGFELALHSDTEFLKDLLK